VDDDSFGFLLRLGPGNCPHFTITTLCISGKYATPTLAIGCCYFLLAFTILCIGGRTLFAQHHPAEATKLEIHAALQLPDKPLILTQNAAGRQGKCAQLPNIRRDSFHE